MDQIITHWPELAPTLPLAAGIGLALAVCSLICAILAWRNLRQRQRDLAAVPRMTVVEQTVFEYISTPALDLPLQLSRDPYTRDVISGLGARLSGDYRLRILVLYTALGFTSTDLQLLRRGFLRPQVLALKRCRDLQLPLPDRLWQRLLSHRSRTMRWAAMDYLTTSKGKKSLPWIVDFLAKPVNQRRGMALHLLSSLGAASPASLLTLLAHADNSFLASVTLEALSQYPVPGSEEQLVSEVHKRFSGATFYPALLAAVAVPSPLTHQLLLALASDHRSEVRLVVAQQLAGYPQAATAVALHEMSADLSYDVRYEAVKSLTDIAQSVAIGDALLADVASSEQHPAFGALQAIRLMHMAGEAA